MRIAVIGGDGTGPEVVAEGLKVLQAVAEKVGFEYETQDFNVSGDRYLAAGGDPSKATIEIISEEEIQQLAGYDAIYLGAVGHPDVAPGILEKGLLLKLRFSLDQYVNLRPVKLYPGVWTPLKDKGPEEIDFVVVRENTEGLYASRNAGVRVRGEVAVDNMVITRRGTQRIVRTAFELSRERQGAPADGKRRVTCVDKANVLRSMAFFRRVYDRVAGDYEDVERDYAYVDAFTVHQLVRPETYDVVVAENMFGDIISDLAAATIGGLGLAPSADIGDKHGVFQPSHGTAPDIAGKGIANPIAQILSASMMLVWLGERNDDPVAISAAEAIDGAVGQVLRDPANHTADLGGTATTSAVGDAVAAAVKSIGK